MNTIGERIAFFRKTSGMTQDSLANALGVSPQTVSKWETGTTMPDILLLPVIAEVFDTDINSLFGSKPKHERRYLTRQNLCEEMHGDFLKSLSCFFLGIDNEENVTAEERAEDLKSYFKANRGTQTLVLCNAEGNGVYGDADMALIFNKGTDDIPLLLQSDTAWTVIKRFADGETRTVLKFMIENSERSFTSPLIASKCGIDIKATERELDNLLRLKLISKQDVDTEDAVIYVYRAWGTHKLILVYTMLAIAERLGDYKESYRGFVS